MAEVNIPVLAAIAPVAPRNQGSQGASQQAEQSGQPSFAQVLKSRSQAPEAPASPAGRMQEAQTRRAADKDAQDAGKAGAAETSASVSVDPATQVTTAGLVDPALLLANAGMPSSITTSAAAASSDPGLSTDSSSAQNDAALASSILAAATAALAARPASIAGKAAPEATAGQGGLQIGVASQSPLNLPAQADGAPLSDEGAGGQARSSEILKTGSGKTPELLTVAEGQEKPTAFATELAQATQSLAVEAGSQTTHGVLGSAQSTRASEALPQHEIATPVATRGWAEEVGQKVSWIASRDNGRAELVLTPPTLGRVEVSISMNGDQASATFVTASPAAREALQDAMPRLREVLAQSGINLGQASVNAGNSGQAQSDDPASRSGAGSRLEARSGGLESIEGLAGNAAGNWVRQGSGMVDTFA